MIRTSRKRNRTRRRLSRQGTRFLFEGLESRLVLDAALTVADTVDCGLPTANGEIHCDNPNPPATETPTLQHFASAEELEQHLLRQAVDQWKHLFGTSAPDYYRWYYANYEFDLASASVASARVLTNSAGSVFQVSDSSEGVYSRSNAQVAGVDEGDVVRTDGNYLYIARENRVTIVDAQDPAAMRIVSRVALDHPAGELYVDGDRLTVISSQFSYVVRPAILFDYPFRQSQNVQVSVFDISDRSSPKELTGLDIGGNLVQSRAVGSHIVLVTQDDVSLPAPQLHCQEEPNPNGDSSLARETHRIMLAMPEDGLWHGRTCVYETEEQYVARIGDGLLERVLPHYRTDGQGDQPAVLLTSPTSIAAAGSISYQLISTTVVHVGGDAPVVVDSAGVLASYAGQVYATNEHVYVAVTDWSLDGEHTRLFQFRLGAALDSAALDSVDVTGVGQVSGHLLNQFAMDEHNGSLRVATTEGWGDTATNSVFVLQADQEQKLQVVGSITGITPGETIFAARFLGERGFLVTFERIDPLVALDLSDPQNPTVTGELEIPGFSHYLHPFGSHLIGIGRDANPENGWATNPQVSLFDVSDLAAPKLVDREMIEGGSSAWSAAFFDHHAVSFFEDASILAVPFQFPNSHRWDFPPLGREPGIIPFLVDVVSNQVDRALERLPDGNILSGLASLLGEGEGTKVEPTRPRSGLWVFRLNLDPDAENPIALLGTIVHDQPVERSLRIGNALFTVSHNLVQAHELADPNRLLGELAIGKLVFDDSVSVDINAGATRIDVLANDRVPAGSVISAVSATSRSGTVEIAADGRIVVYTPPASQTNLLEREAGVAWNGPVHEGQDSFSYTVDLGNDLSERGTVYVRLTSSPVLPSVAELAREDLAARLAIPIDEIKVTHVERREWPDGCLGVYVPDQACPMVVTPGYVVWLTAMEQRYRYHTDTESTVIFVEPHEPKDDGVVADEFRVHQDSTANELDVLANDFPNMQFIRPPQITAVSVPSQGGRVEIQEGGLKLIYTPEPGFHGTETFTYTVDNGPTGRVAVHVLEKDAPPDRPGDSAAVIAIRLDLTDGSGQAVTQLDLGDPFFINVYVKDLRDEAQGVFSTYLDLRFDVRLAEVSGDIEFSSQFSNGISGASDRSGVDELGAFADSVKPLGAGEWLLARIPMEAVGAGQFAVTTNPADLAPLHDSAVYGWDDSIGSDRIEFGSVEVPIVNGFFNESEPTDANGDGTTTPTDALPIINWINEHGAGSVRMLRAAELAAEAAGEGYHRESRRFDTNGDGHCTHMDVLTIFNRVNTIAARRAGEGEAAGELLAADQLATAPSSMLPETAIDVSRIGSQNGPATHSADRLSGHDSRQSADLTFHSQPPARASSPAASSADLEFDSPAAVDELLDDLVAHRQLEALDALFSQLGV